MKLLSALACTVLLLSGCSSQPKPDYDLNYSFDQLHSFSLQAPKQSSDTLTTERIQKAIIDNLTAREYQQSEPADFIVTFTSGKMQNNKRKPSIGLGLGGGLGAIGIGTGISMPIGDNKKLENIQIDIHNAANNKVIWSGNRNFEFTDGGEEKAQITKETVDEILNDFPPEK